MDSAAHHAAYEHQGGYQSNDKARNLKPYDRELDLALLDVKNRVRTLSL
jgi:hypothetical protein